MAIRLIKKDSFSIILKKYFSEENETLSLEPLSEIITSLKREDLGVFTAYLKDNSVIRKNLIHYIKNIFEERSFNLSITEADILSENAFFPEFKKRLLNKVLPPIENEKTVWFLVDNVLVTPKKDLEFFQNSPEEKMDELFRLLEIDRFIDKVNVKKELLFSLNILAWRVIGNALDVEVVKMAPEYKNFDNPFLALQNELDILNADFKEKPDFNLSSSDEIYKQIKVYLEQCLEFVNIAFKNASKYGISSKTNQSLLKIRQQLNRMSDVLKLFIIDEDRDYLINSKQLFFNILKYKSHKNNLRDLVSDSTRLMSHLITNHTAEVGTHYITSTFGSYMKMFWRASGGGVIVGALCILKMLYSYIPASDFAHALLFSFNYAMGFVMIYLMRFSLATKQPAMTAATMAKVLSEGSGRSAYMEFAHVVSQLFRSQFIAFVGNVLLSFPVSLAIIYGLEILFKQNFAFEKSGKLLYDLDPFQSKAILHACIAGVFLFISGVISGNIGNNSVFYQIPKRIEKNPFINYFFGQRIAKQLSVYYSKNWAGIVSNFWFGVFLGATAPVGLFLGLDLDIRHITFAAGNFALGLYGKDFVISSYTFWISFSTVFVIGFCNFIVSFGLSMLLAFRSRRVEIQEAKEIFREIFRYFIRNPFRFFFPLRSLLDEKSKKMIQGISTKSEDH